MMIIRQFEPKDSEEVVGLIMDFRSSFSQLKSTSSIVDEKSAQEELEYYLTKGYPIYVGVVENQIVAYLVCRTEDGVVWAESLYIVPTKRRRGFGSLLYVEAEKLAEQYGSDTVYNWVHPSNSASINFLRNLGYDVLNLIEVRKARKEEDLSTTIQVGRHEFKY